MLNYFFGDVQLLDENAKAIKASAQKATLPIIIVAGIVALVLFFFVRGK